MMITGGIGMLVGTAVKLLVPEPKRKIKVPVVEEIDEDDDDCDISMTMDDDKNLLTCFKDLLKRPITKWMTFSASLQ